MPKKMPNENRIHETRAIESRIPVKYFHYIPEYGIL